MLGGGSGGWPESQQSTLEVTLSCRVWGPRPVAQSTVGEQRWPFAHQGDLRSPHAPRTRPHWGSG